MKFLYRKYPAKRGEVIEVNMTGSATVKFMTAKEFKKYGAGRTHTYYKGRGDGTTVSFELPFDGIWHAVVEKSTPELTATCRLLAAPEEPPMLEAPRPKEPEQVDAQQEE